MLELRMPLMISGAYTPATAHMEMFKKDLTIIGEDVPANGISAPMFDAASDLYDKSYSLVSMEYDTTAILVVERDADGKA